MTNWRTRIVAVAFGAIAPPLLALGGCAISAGSGLTPAAARDDLRAALDETQVALGGAWDNRDDPTPRGCVIPLFVDGEQYPALRVGPPPHDTDEALATVANAWDERGYSVATTTVGDVTELQAHTSVDALLVFRVSAEAMTLQGESECRPSE